MSSYLRCFVIPLFASLLCAAALATWIEPDETVPLERLVKNYERYVGEHPDDVRGYYWLARAYSLGFALAQQEFGIWDNNRPEEGPTMFYDLHQSERKAFQDASPDLLSKRKDCLVQSMRWFEKGIAHITSTTNTQKVAGLWMGLGWMYEEGAQFAGEVACPIEEDVSASEQQEILRLIGEVQSSDAATAERATGELNVRASNALALLERAYDSAATDAGKERLRPVLRRGWEDRAIAAYKTAYKTAREDSLKYKSYNGLAMESAKGIQTILGTRKEKTTEEEKLTKELTNETREMESLPRTVTPVIFSLSRKLNLQDLLESDKKVAFDLDGYGRDVRWPWVKSDTMLLAWDPLNTGRIDSGRRLIGTATWWMLWQDGFHALRALDDNNDGWLAGDELQGLAVWQDKNSDGKSDPGEVTPIGSTQIARLSVSATESGPGFLANAKGLVLKDANVLPLYDWIPQSIDRMDN